MFDILRYAAPVGLAAMGETVNQKCGLLNIGLEGMMLAGGFCAMLATRQTGNPWIGLLAGIAVGVLMAILAGAVMIPLAGDQVVVGAAINLVALGVTGTVYRNIFGTSGALLSINPLPKFAGGLDAVLVLFIFSVPVLWWILFRSKFGLVLRAVGEKPEAVIAAGFNANRIRWTGILISGAFAGLAGAYLSVGITASFAENFTNGKGFIAIAMVTFGRFHPAWVFVASCLIGAVDGLQYWLQATGYAAKIAQSGITLSPPFFIALPYVIALIVLVVTGKGAKSPRALGVPLRKGK
jgi:general nucleoside transport system permease protein